MFNFWFQDIRDITWTSYFAAVNSSHLEATMYRIVPCTIQNMKAIYKSDICV